MLKTFELLNDSEIVESIEIKDSRHLDDISYFKCVVILKDNSKLYINEFISLTEINYSYHWQDKNDKMMYRWDNAPHHKNIITFPHHVHIKNQILPYSYSRFEEILKKRRFYGKHPGFFYYSNHQTKSLLNNRYNLL